MMEMARLDYPGQEFGEEDWTVLPIDNKAYHFCEGPESNRIKMEFHICNTIPVKL